MYHTIGQRQGLGIGGPGEAWYVVGKDLARNVLLVAQGEQHPALFAPALTAEQIHWVAGMAPALPARVTAKTRYRQPDQPCTIAPADDGLRVDFAQPQRAIAPGQSVVFYRDDECLGGGVIARALPTASSTPAADTNVKCY